MNTKISLADISDIFHLLFQKYQELNIDFIETKKEYYWDIDKHELYDPYNEPKNLTLGQLSFDLEELKKIASENRNVVSYDLELIARVLKVISVESAALF
jgi:hypothetical protein